MAEHVIALTGGNFAQTMYDGVTLVDFWAPWCGPCRVQGPIVEKVAARLHGKAQVTKLNVDENQATAEEYGIRSIPTLIVFKDGKPDQQLVGVQTEQALVSAVEAALKQKGAEK